VIVRPEGDTLVLVRQPDHARLSGDLVAAWREDGLPEDPRREEILAAVAGHDDGWAEPDAAPLWDPASGRPYDFVTAPDDVRLSVWPRGVERVRARHGPFAAALVARHPIALYDAYGRPAGAADLVARLEARIEELLREDGRADRRRLDAAYRFVAIGDLLSLAFCSGWEEREILGYRIRVEGSRLLVAPNPFGGAEIEISVPCRRLEAASYPSERAMREAWEEAPAAGLEGTAAGDW
jgi:hypothetical protein